jgi:hypothetical protein
MNVEEINPDSLATLPQYFATAIPLTVLTVWIMVAFQFHPGSSRRSRSQDSHHNDLVLGMDNVDRVERSLIWRTVGRIGWPVMLALDLVERWRARRRKLHSI